MLPKFSQFKQIFKVLNKKERIAILILLVLAIGSLGFLLRSFYVGATKLAPAAGGTYTEGIVGQPRFINPIYGETSDINRTLTDLVFSGLMTYDKDGKIVKDLASDYKISDDGKVYDFQLKNNVFWHDSKPLTADDVVFTINTIQNPDYKSPLRANWIDVDVQKTSEKSVRFILKTPYNSFLENATVKIVPKHIWQNIPAENFAISYYNLQPIGSGPFAFSSIKQNNTGFIESLDLQKNSKYYDKAPYISKLSFTFFENKEGLVQAANRGGIDGFSLASLDNNELEAEKEVNQGWSSGEKFSVYYFSLPRYFAVFFNSNSEKQKSSILSNSNIRKALTYAVNKDELTQKINSETKDTISKVDSPILPDFFGYQAPSNVYGFDLNQAKSLLDKEGFKDNGQGMREKATNKKPAFQFRSYLKVGSKGNEVTQLQSCLSRLDDNFKNILQDETTGKYASSTEKAVTEFQKKYLPGQKPTGETGKSTRDQLNRLCTSQPNAQQLKFTLVTINQAQLVRVAQLLKDYWKAVGVDVEIQAVLPNDLKTIIKERRYDALLYGQALGAEPDIYPFWYSSQKIDPGLNLSYYENKDVDALLKGARETLDEPTKKQKYEQLQNIIIKDAPALFLYNPDYVYWVSSKVKGVDTTKIIDPAERFVNIANWYTKTHRVWK